LSYSKTKDFHTYVFSSNVGLSTTASGNLTLMNSISNCGTSDFLNYSEICRLHVFPFLIIPQNKNLTAHENAFVLQIFIFRFAMSCGLVGGYQWFRGTYRLHLQGRLLPSETLVTSCETTRRHPENRNPHFRRRERHALVLFN
jgi:hypothetical protein